MKILVIQQKMIGDVLVSSILCDNLRKAYPAAQIDYMVYESTIAVLQGNPSFDNLILFKEKHRNSKLEFLKLIFSIRRENYNIIIDAYSKLESWLVVLFSGSDKKISYWKKHTNFIYTDSVKKIKESNSNLGSIIEQRLALLDPLKLTFTLTSNPEIYITPTELEFADVLFSENGIDPGKKTIMVNISGSSGNKTYPLHYMARLIDFIADKGEVNLLLNYHPKQFSEATELMSYCKESTRQKIYSVLGNNIREFIAIMNNCDMIIGNDGGAMNMAKALQKPSFIIFSPWIDKKGWATFEDGKNNISVHLKDLKPELFTDQNPAAIKKQALKLYHLFTPDLLIPALNHFLENHLDQSYSSC